MNVTKLHLVWEGVLQLDPNPHPTTSPNNPTPYPPTPHYILVYMPLKVVSKWNLLQPSSLPPPQPPLQPSRYP